MKLALHTVSYAGVWEGQAVLPMERVFDKAAEFGYQGIELVAKRPHASLLEMDCDRRAEIRARLQDRGLELACLAGYTDFCAGADSPGLPFRELHVVYVTELARLASDLGGNMVRVFTGYERAQFPLRQQWSWCVETLRLASRRAAEFGVTLAIQNHHDLGVHHDSMHDLIEDVGESNCRTAWDAWAPALSELDLAEGVRRLAPYIVHTTAADYVRRPRFRYVTGLTNYAREQDIVRAVPMGTGCIDYGTFLGALRDSGYEGYVAYEMCEVLEGGGSEENLDRCARIFVEWMRANGFARS
jgi:sugar phosphate isomerase/epimerase